MTSTTPARVTADDLALAASWCRTYEGAEDDTTGAALARVAAYLDREVARREAAAQEADLVRQVVARQAAAGRPVTPAQARTALRKVRARPAEAPAEVQGRAEGDADYLPRSWEDPYRSHDE